MLSVLTILYTDNPAIVISTDYFGLQDGTSESLTVGFKAFGDPVPVITSMTPWYFQGNEVNSGLSITQLGSQFIFFSAQGFVAVYSGEYTITIETTAGTNNASFVLDVFGELDSFVHGCFAYSHFTVSMIMITDYNNTVILFLIF